ncbi:calpain-7-like isoform X2 [Prorops nasuta]|uniref:calpain-7-like isoform X2 n=1 Tax=Prorops nasuta TaxID=863751 RepID=UPI0034CD7437
MASALLWEELSFVACKAVEYDSNRQFKQALCYYEIAVKYLKKLCSFDTSGNLINGKLLEYQDRVLALQESNETNYQVLGQTQESLLQWCKFLVTAAFEADEKGFISTAVILYTDAVEAGLIAKKTEVDEETKFTNLVKQALDRAEDLKGIRKKHNIDNDVIARLDKLPPLPENSLFDSELPINAATTSFNPQQYTKPPLHRGSSAHLKITGGSTNYTVEEKRVLLHSSHINDHEFVPFMNVDLAEKFQYTIQFTDKDGLLVLSPKQKPDFSKWCRPKEMFPEPRMVINHHVDYYSIKQTVVSDCSFVASLAVSAQYEKKFGKRLITSIIYPKNKNDEPIYNPHGKYMVKLHINGVPRKVIIDDLLPVSRYNQLLCSYSSNGGELWISLLEKAYMKVMGGYDFPGSNSNIDLHALTGWIPERWAIRPNDADFNKDSLFEKLLLGFHKGEVLVTVATGELTDLDAERTGLVPTHAYAVLNIKKINGKRLFQLKNPWSHLRWRGNYSELDSIHWTQSLREALNYDPDSACQYDNGIFWIDYDSICNFFDVFYFNWNPGLFTHTYCMHQMWNAGVGPMKDAYNIGDNPQFVLETENNNSGTVWILLTRHITDIKDFRQNQEYITVLVYNNDGRRVYYPRQDLCTLNWKMYLQEHITLYRRHTYQIRRDLSS